jgi:hypothetical protein
VVAPVKTAPGFQEHTMHVAKIAATLTVLLLALPVVVTAAKPKPSLKTPAATPATPAVPALPDLAATLKALRTAMTESAAKNENPDLTELMLGGLAETSWVALVHGHYGLSGTGHGMRAGSIPATDAATVADDIARNGKRLGELFGQFAGCKNFDPGLQAIFREVQALAGQCEATGRALHAWAGDRSDEAKTKAFEQALESYRGKMQDVAKRLQGP